MVGGVWVEYEPMVGGGLLIFLGVNLMRNWASYMGLFGCPYFLICEFIEEAVAGWVKEDIAHETFWVTSWSHFCCWCCRC